MSPLDYSLCAQTVTLYRREGDTLIRRVLEGCLLERKTGQVTESYGKSRRKTFLLIIPAELPAPRPGDRVYEGIGPEVVDWESFLPVQVEGLMQIGSVKACRWAGELTHWEAC